MCDPDWCVHKSDVQNKWDDTTLRHTDTHTDTHTHTHTHKMTRMTGAGLRGYVQFDKYTHTHTHYTHTRLTSESRRSLLGRWIPRRGGSRSDFKPARAAGTADLPSLVLLVRALSAAGVDLIRSSSKCPSYS